MIRATCKLCLTDQPLARSHIVPEFAYEPIKNEKKQIHIVGPRDQVVQSGYREHLLCVACEGRLVRLEKSFKEWWMDTIPSKFNFLFADRLTTPVSVSIPEYSTFKLFHLSVLWRAFCSKGFNVGGYSLGPFEDRLRRMLLSSDAGNLGDFPIYGRVNLDELARPVATVGKLYKGTGRLESHHYYLMNYAYCDWTFVIAQPGPQWIAEIEEKFRLNRNFVLFTQPHASSHSFRLGVDLLRQMTDESRRIAKEKRTNLVR